jgi:hypothetical protein
MYRIFMPGGFSGIKRNWLRMGRNAASVFPVAVGAISSTFLPLRMSGIAFVWGSVGLENPRSLMAFRIGFANSLKTLVEAPLTIKDPRGKQKNYWETVDKRVLRGK